jgi:hypothetical protein
MNSINATRSDDYLKFLPLIVGSSILLAFIYPKGIIGVDNSSHLITYYYTASFVVCQLIYWLVIGKLTQNRKAATTALVAYLLLTGAQLAYSSSKIEQHEPSNSTQALYLIGYLVIPFIFAFQTFNKNRYWDMLLFAVVYSIMPMSIRSASIVRELFRFEWLFSDAEVKIPLVNGAYFMLNVVDLFYDTLINIAKIAILSALVEHQKKFDFGFSDKFLNFNNTYSRAQAFVIFIATKVLIIALPFYIIHIMIMTVRRKFEANSTFFEVIMPFIYSFLGFIALYFIVQFYRKFMLELLYSKEIVPSYAYWFVLIPFIGTLIFIALFLDEKEAVTPEKRVASFLNAYSTNGSNTIALIMAGLQIISLILLIVARPPDVFLIGLSTLILCLFYSYSKVESTIYVFIGLFLLFDCYALFHYERAFAELLLRMLYQIPLLYILGGIFHIHAFEYLPNLSETDVETDVETTENGDLLSF